VVDRGGLGGEGGVGEGGGGAAAGDGRGEVGPALGREGGRALHDVGGAFGGGPRERGLGGRRAAGEGEDGKSPRGRSGRVAADAVGHHVLDFAWGQGFAIEADIIELPGEGKAEAVVIPRADVQAGGGIGGIL